MFAVMTGMFFGFIQLFVLSRLINALLSGDVMKTTFLIVLKLLVWGVFLLIIILFFKTSVLQAITGASGTLVLGGTAIFLYRWYRQEKDKNNTNKKGKSI